MLTKALSKGMTRSYPASGPRSSSVWRLKVLYLDGNNIGIEGVKMVAEALKVMAFSRHRCCIKRFSLCSTNIGVEEVKIIADTLKTIALSHPTSKPLLDSERRLCLLDLGHNHIGCEGMNIVSDVLKITTLYRFPLKTLYVWDNNISNATFETIVEKMKNNSYKNSLILKGYNFSFP